MTDRDWQNRDDGSVWINGGSLASADIENLQATRSLTLNGTRVSRGVLEELRQLVALDLRTTSANATNQVAGLTRLEYLSLAHNRVIDDLSAVSALARLTHLNLYALSKVKELPDMHRMTSLWSLSVGQMRLLVNWSALLDAPGLGNLSLANSVAPDLDVLRELSTREHFTNFYWWAPDVPAALVAAAVKAANRPPLDAPG